MRLLDVWRYNNTGPVIVLARCGDKGVGYLGRVTATREMSDHLVICHNIRAIITRDAIRDQDADLMRLE